MDSEEPKKPKRSHRGWWIAAGVVVFAAAIVAMLWLNGQRRLQRKIEELHAKGFPITFEEIEQKRRLPEGTPNAADLYQQAFGAYQELSEQDDIMLSPMNPVMLREPWEPLSKEITTAIDRFLNNNQQTITLLAKASIVKDCRFPVNYSTIPPLLPYLKETSKCRRLLFLSGLYQIEVENKAGILKAMREQNGLASALSQYPFLVDYSTYYSVCRENILLVQISLNRTDLNKEFLMKLSGSFRSGLLSPNLEAAYRNELPYLLHHLNNPSLILQYGIPPQFKSPIWKLSSVIRSNIMECMDRLDEMVSICGSSSYARFQYIRSLKTKTGQSLLHDFSNMYVSSLIDSVERNLRFQAEMGATQVAIAIEQYRLDTGKIPDRLEDLVPKYMEKVPIDPFDGKPLRYKRLEKGYTIYSIGEDGKDDGGKKKDRGEKDFDYPFTVRR